MDLSGAILAPNTSERARVDRGSRSLLGARCESCGSTAWPATAACHRCGRAVMREATFGPEGRLVSATTVWVSRPGLAAPYVLGQVQIAEGPQVFCHVRGLESEAQLPLEVEFEFAREDDAVPLFWCRPTSGSAGSG